MHAYVIDVCLHTYMHTYTSIYQLLSYFLPSAFSVFCGDQFLLRCWDRGMCHCAQFIYSVSQRVKRLRLTLGLGARKKTEAELKFKCLLELRVLLL